MFFPRPQIRHMNKKYPSKLPAPASAFTTHSPIIPPTLKLTPMNYPAKRLHISKSGNFSAAFYSWLDVSNLLSQTFLEYIFFLSISKDGVIYKLIKFLLDNFWQRNVHHFFFESGSIWKKRKWETIIIYGIEWKNGIAKGKKGVWLEEKCFFLGSKWGV